MRLQPRRFNANCTASGWQSRAKQAERSGRVCPMQLWRKSGDTQRPGTRAGSGARIKLCSLLQRHSAAERHPRIIKTVSYIPLRHPRVPHLPRPKRGRPGAAPHWLLGGLQRPWRPMSSPPPSRSRWSRSARPQAPPPPRRRAVPTSRIRRRCPRRSAQAARKHARSSPPSPHARPPNWPRPRRGAYWRAAAPAPSPPRRARPPACRPRGAQAAATSALHAWRRARPAARRQRQRRWQRWQRGAAAAPAPSRTRARPPPARAAPQPPPRARPPPPPPQLARARWPHSCAWRGISPACAHARRASRRANRSPNRQA
mmetsp:Transcript_10026/g.25206  ORF Transcript_10026/g.25206 Transcript_10026/m.25206 type:complete len:315 (+) Transcript_10026:201-1145(+)